MKKIVIIFIILASFEVVLSYQNETPINTKGMDIDSKEKLTTTESVEDRLIHDHYLLKQSKPSTEKSTTETEVKDQVPSASNVQAITVAAPNGTKPEGKNHTKPNENPSKTSQTSEKGSTKSTSEAQATTPNSAKSEVDQIPEKNSTKLNGILPQTSQNPEKGPTKSSSEVQTKSGAELGIGQNPGENSTKAKENIPLTSGNNLKKLPFEGQAERIEKLLKSLNEPKWPANPMENLPQTSPPDKNFTKSTPKVQATTTGALPGAKLEANLIPGSQNLGGGSFQVIPETKLVTQTSRKNGTKENLNRTSSPPFEVKSTTKIPGIKLEGGDLNNGKNGTVSKVQDKLSHSSTTLGLASEVKSTTKSQNGTKLENNQTSGKNSTLKVNMPATIPVNMVPISEAKSTSKAPGVKLEGGDLNTGKNSTIPKVQENMPHSSTTPGLASEVKSTIKSTKGTKLDANQTSGKNGTSKENTVQGIPPTKSFVTAASQVLPTTIKASNGTKLEGGDLNSGKNGTLPPKVQENGLPAASRIQGVPLYILSKLKSSQNGTKPNELHFGTKPNAAPISEGQIVPVSNHSNASKVADNSTVGYNKMIHNSLKNFTKANAEINQVTTHTGSITFIKISALTSSRGIPKNVTGSSGETAATIQYLGNPNYSQKLQLLGPQNNYAQPVTPKATSTDSSTVAKDSSVQDFTQMVESKSEGLKNNETTSASFYSQKNPQPITRSEEPSNLQEWRNFKMAVQCLNNIQKSGKTSANHGNLPDKNTQPKTRLEEPMQNLQASETFQKSDHGLNGLQKDKILGNLRSVPENNSHSEPMNITSEKPSTNRNLITYNGITIDASKVRSSKNVSMKYESLGWTHSNTFFQTPFIPKHNLSGGKNSTDHFQKSSSGKAITTSTDFPKKKVAFQTPFIPKHNSFVGKNSTDQPQKTTFDNPITTSTTIPEKKLAPQKPDITAFSYNRSTANDLDHAGSIKGSLKFQGFEKPHLKVFNYSKTYLAPPHLDLAPQWDSGSRNTRNVERVYKTVIEPSLFQKPLAREPKDFSAEFNLKGSASNDYFLKTQALPFKSEGTFFRPPIVAVDNNGVGIVDKKLSSEVQVQKTEPNAKTIGKVSKAGGLNISEIYIKKYWLQNSMKNGSSQGHGAANKEHSIGPGHNLPLQNHSHTHSVDNKGHFIGSAQNPPSSKAHEINSAHNPSLQNNPGNGTPNKDYSMGPGHNMALQNRFNTNSAENKGHSIVSAQNPPSSKEHEINSAHNPSLQNTPGNGAPSKNNSMGPGHSLDLQNHFKSNGAEYKDPSMGSVQNSAIEKEHQLNSGHNPSLQNLNANGATLKQSSIGSGHSQSLQNHSIMNSAGYKDHFIGSAHNPAPGMEHQFSSAHNPSLQNSLGNGAANKENSMSPGHNFQPQNQNKEPFQISAKNSPAGQVNSAHSPSLQNHYANVATFKENSMGLGHKLASQNHSKTNGAGIKEPGMGSAKTPFSSQEPQLNSAHSPLLQNHPPGSVIVNKDHSFDSAHGPSLQNHNANGASMVLGHNLPTQGQSKTNGGGIKEPGLSSAKNPLPGKTPPLNSAHSPYLQNIPINAVSNNQQSVGPGHGLPSQSHFKTNGAEIKEPVLGSGPNQPSGKENHFSSAHSPSFQNHPPGIGSPNKDQAIDSAHSVPSHNASKPNEPVHFSSAHSPSLQNHPPGIGSPNKDHPIASAHSLPSHNASKPNGPVHNEPSLGSTQNAQNDPLIKKGGLPLNLMPPVYPPKNFTSITPKPLPKTLMIGGNNSNPQLVPVVQTGPIKKYGTGVVPNPNVSGPSGLVGMASTFIPRVTTPYPGSFHNFGGFTVRSADQTQGLNLLAPTPFLTTAKVVVNPLDIAITAKPISSAEKGTMTHRPIGTGLYLNRQPQETNANPAQNATKTVANSLASHPSGNNVTLNVQVQKTNTNGVSNFTQSAPGTSRQAVPSQPIGANVNPNAKVSNASGIPSIPNSAGFNLNVQPQKNGTLGAPNTTPSTLGSHTTMKFFTPLSILTALRSSAQMQKPAPTNSTHVQMDPSHGQVSTARPVISTHVPFGNGILNGEKKATNSHPKPHLENTTPKSPNLTPRPTVGSGPTTPKLVLATPSPFYAGPSVHKPGPIENRIGDSTMKPVQAGHGAPLNAGTAFNGPLPGAPKPLYAGPTTHKTVPIENKIGVSTMKPVQSGQGELLNAQFYGGTTHIPGPGDYKIGASTMKSVPGFPGGPPNAQIATSKTIGANSIVVTTLRPSTIIIVPSSTVNSIVPNSIPLVLGSNAEKASAAKILNTIQHTPPVPEVITMHPPGPGGSPKTVSSTIGYAPKMAEHPKIPGNLHLSTLAPPYLNAGPGGLPKTISTTHIPKSNPPIAPTPKPPQITTAPSLEHGLGGLPKTVSTTMHPIIIQTPYNPEYRQHDPFGLRKVATTSPPYVGPGGLPKAKPHTSPKPKLDTVLGPGLLDIPGEQRPNVNKVAPIESGPLKLPPSTTTRPLPQVSPVVPKNPQGTIRPNQMTIPTTKPGESINLKSATGLPGLPKMGSTTSNSKITESSTKAALEEKDVYQSTPKDSAGNRASFNGVPNEPNMSNPQKPISGGKMDTDSQIREELEIPQDVELFQESPDPKESPSNGAKVPSENQQSLNVGTKFSKPNSPSGASGPGFKIGNPKSSAKNPDNTSNSGENSDGDTDNDLVVEQDFEVDKNKKDVIIEHDIFVKNGPRPTNSQKIDKNEVTINRRSF